MTNRRATARRSSGPLRAPYDALSIAAARNLRGEETREAILALTTVALKFLGKECVVVPLLSKVPGKQYYSYALHRTKTAYSRPVNKALFEASPSVVAKGWEDFGSLKPNKLKRLLYTMGTAFAVASDMFDRNNKKAPATYLEHVVGHVFASEFGENPTKKATLPLPGGGKSKLTMDFLFDLGRGKAKVHLPVKSSTRERVVQAWAHQRILDAAFGIGTYRALLVVHSETKLDMQTREVVEITVPDQWLAYQSLLARMERIYYLDPPERYVRLSTPGSGIDIKELDEFFGEKDTLLELK